MEDGKKVFLRYKTTLGSPAVLDTVGVEDATLFDDPDVVEGIIRDFSFRETPTIEVMNVSHVRSISDNVDKYQVFLEMAKERSVVEDDENKEASEEADSTFVFYRKVIKPPMAGDVIAIFPFDVFDIRMNMASYMHVGQHSGCSIDFILNDTIATKSACDTHGCMEEELNEYGYKKLDKIPYDAMAWKPKAKCLYCDSGNEPTHFICEDCGDGMCEECYDAEIEHDNHYQDPSCSAETEEEFLVLSDVFDNGYGCVNCVDKAMLMLRNMTKQEENDDA
jgi:hypothetical protein